MTRLDKGKSNLVVEIDFDYDVDTDKVEPRSSTEFLKPIEDNCGDIPDKDMKLEVILNSVSEKIQRMIRRRTKAKCQWECLLFDQQVQQQNLAQI